MRTFDDTTERSLDVARVPVGTYVKRKADAKKVYIAAGYCDINHAWQLDDADDISRCLFVKTGSPVFVGFTY